MLKSQILMAELTKVKASAKELTVAAEIEAKITEIENLKAQIKIAEMDEEEEKAEALKLINNKKVPEVLDSKAADKLHVLAFAKAIAKKELNEEEIKALSVKTDADGGYLIPKDIKTAIIELNRQYISLREHVSTEPVTTMSGVRTIELNAERNAFVDIDELVDLPTLNGPQFGKIDYKIRDLGGLLPIPNDLLDDNTAGLTQYLAGWFAKKMFATDNAMILNADGTKGSQGMLGMAGKAGGFASETLTAPLTFVKARTVLNKELPVTHGKAARIITNQDGLEVMDGWSDSQGRPLLTGDGTEEFPYIFKGRKVYVYDNEVMANVVIATKNYAPFIFGDTKSALVLLDRQQMSVATSKEAGFKNNSTLMRAIVRQDTRIVDVKAIKVIYSLLP